MTGEMQRKWKETAGQAALPQAASQHNPTPPYLTFFLLSAAHRHLSSSLSPDE